MIIGFWGMNWLCIKSIVVDHTPVVSPPMVGLSVR